MGWSGWCQGLAWVSLCGAVEVVREKAWPIGAQGAHCSSLVLHLPLVCIITDLKKHVSMEKDLKSELFQFPKKRLPFITSETGWSP